MEENKDTKNYKKESENEINQNNYNKDKELLKIRKKYSIKYVLTAKLIEVYIIFLLVIIFSFCSGATMIGIFSIFILIVIVFCTLIFSKKSAAQTYISFYEDKVIYKRKFLFIDKEKIVEYSNIKDIVFTQGTSWYTRIWQKILKLGNIYIYPKKGNIITNGISLEVVDNIDKVIEDIKTIVGDRIK